MARAVLRFASVPTRRTALVPLPMNVVSPAVFVSVRVPLRTDRFIFSLPLSGSSTLIAFAPVNARLWAVTTFTNAGAVISGFSVWTVIGTLAEALRVSSVSWSVTLRVSAPTRLVAGIYDSEARSVLRVETEPVSVTDPLPLPMTDDRPEVFASVRRPCMTERVSLSVSRPDRLP